MTDKQINDLLKSDFEKGFDALFDKYYKSLVIYAAGMTGNLEVSEDIVQTTLYKCIRNKTIAKVGEDKLRSYLFMGVRNTSLNHISSHKNLFPLDGFPEPRSAGGPEEAVYDDEMIARIKSEISRMPQRTRQIIEDIMLNRMKYKEVAEKYSISVNTVKMLLGRGLKKLRTYAGEEAFLFFICLCMISNR